MHRVQVCLQLNPIHVHMSCEGEGLHNGWAVYSTHVLCTEYCEEIVKGNTLVTHRPTGIELPVDVANSLSY